MTEGNDGGYMRHQCAKNQNLTTSPKMIILKKKHINLMGELQWISNPSKVIKPLNSNYFHLCNTYYVNNLEELLQIEG
jgi:hypothetical protein